MKLNIHGYAIEDIDQLCKDWLKIKDVCASCETPEQIKVADNMLNLYRKKYAPKIVRKKKERWYMPIVTLTLTSVLCGLVFIMATGGF